MNDDTSSSNSDMTRAQLIGCIQQLGERAKELEEYNIAGILYTVVGALIEGEEEFSAICHAYALMRVQAECPDKDENESSPQV